MTLREMLSKKFKITNDFSPFKCEKMTRYDLVDIMKEMGFKSGAEVGVLKGEFSFQLCHTIPGLKLKCIDPWTHFRMNSRDKMEACYNITCQRLKSFDVEIIRKTSMDAVREIPDKSLDFVYIDGMHEFDFVAPDLIFWSDKVKSGGIVAGHDYQEPMWFNGVKSAVLAYTFEHGIKEWYLTGEITTHASNPSFFWMKP